MADRKLVYPSSGQRMSTTTTVDLFQTFPSVSACAPLLSQPPPAPGVSHFGDTWTFSCNCQVGWRLFCRLLLIIRFCRHFALIALLFGCSQTQSAFPKFSPRRRRCRRRRRRPLWRKSDTANRKNMSWQDYVDKQLLASGFVNHAAIIGTDGALWAKSAAFNVSLNLFVWIVKWKMWTPPTSSPNASILSGDFFFSSCFPYMDMWQLNHRPIIWPRRLDWIGYRLLFTDGLPFWEMKVNLKILQPVKGGSVSGGDTPGSFNVGRCSFILF